MPIGFCERQCIERSGLLQVFYHTDGLLPYKVGGLLYTPATRGDVASNLDGGVFDGLTSLAFCLEDAVMDSAVPAAERQLVKTLASIEESGATRDQLPLLFVRVRTPQHLIRIHDALGSLEYLLTGYIFPKFDLHNADEFLEVLVNLNAGRRLRLYAMPILESASISRAETRLDTLAKLSSTIGFYKELILNIRVGGNDLCSQFGIRRDADQNIYDIGVVRDALVDIIGVFGRDYVVSGPVWEYYGDTEGDWEAGLRAEMRLDSLNGFVGKTAIHPRQVTVINECMKVARRDYEDAKLICNWSLSENAVSGSSKHDRMNELKCHSRWAEKTLCLAEVYGIRGDA